MKTIILADGAFPQNEKLLAYLRDAEQIICCDGAAKSLLEFGREPDAIVGDMDSLSDELKLKYQHIVYPSADQETNDLTKAVEYCLMKKYQKVAILGATGMREDHTLGNISLLAEYVLKLEEVCMLTDYGRVDAIRQSKNFSSLPGQQISIFALTPETTLTAYGLLYPIEGRVLTSWWQGTLNQAVSDNFRLEMDKGCLLVYRLY